MWPKNISRWSGYFVSPGLWYIRSLLSWLSKHMHFSTWCSWIEESIYYVCKQGGKGGYPNVANLSTKGWSKILKFYNRSLWMAPYKSYRQRVILMIHSKRVNALFQCIQTCNAPLRLSEYLWESQLGFSWLCQSWGGG